MREPTCPELGHEVREREGGEVFLVDRNPIIDQIILKAPQDPGDLEIVFNSPFGVNKIVEAMVFEVFGRLWSDFSIGELRGTGDNKMGAGGNLLVGHFGVDSGDEEGRVVGKRRDGGQSR